MIQFIKKHSTICLILLLTLLYSSYIIWENIKLPVNFMDGTWHYVYAHNITAGKIMYQDFYCIVPPLWFYILSIFTSIIDTYTAVSISNIVFYTLYFFLIMYSIYYITDKKKNYHVAYFIVFIISLFVFTSTSTLIFEYNRFISLLLILSIFCIYNIIKNKKFLRMNIFFIGLLCSFMLLTKQSIGIIYSSFYFLFLLYFCTKQKHNLEFKNILYFIFGFIVGLFPFIMWLIYYNNFIPFLNSCVFGLQTATSNFIYNILDLLCMILILISIFIFFIIQYKRKYDDMFLFLALFLFPSITFIYPVCNMVHFSCIFPFLIIGIMYYISNNVLSLTIKNNIRFIIILTLIFVFKIIYSYYSVNIYESKVFSRDIFIPNEYLNLQTDFDLMTNYIIEHPEYDFYSPDSTYQYLMLESKREIPSELSLFCKGSLGTNNPVDLMTKYESENSLYFINKKYIMYQIPKEAIDYICNNYELIDTIGESFEIYKPK